MKKNIIITFMCACVPGFGQMYQGYMKRGVSLSVLFWGTIAVGSFFMIEEILFFVLPVVYGYSFFDAFNIRALTEEQRYYFHDEFLLPQNMSFLRKTKQATINKVIGYSLIGIGLYSVYNMFLSWSYNWLSETIRDILYRIPTAVFAIIIIYVGLKLLKGNSNDDIIPYKGDENHE